MAVDRTLVDAVSALAADDIASMFAPQVRERLINLLRVRTEIEAELTRTVREAEIVSVPELDGLTSITSWLRGHGHLTPADAKQLLGNGRALEHLPAVEKAFRAGAVTADQITVIATIVTPENRDAAAAQGVDLTAIDDAMATVAGCSTHRETADKVAAYLAHLNPDGPEPDPTEGRSLTIAKFGDGSRSLRGLLDAVGGEKVEAALESIVQANRPAGDLRSRAQQLADALVQLADNQLAGGHLPTLRTVKPSVIVTIPLEDLVGDDTGPAAGTTGFGATISAAQARWLACDGAITRIVIGPDGQPLDVGRTQRVVPPHIRKAVEHRDKNCVFAGCGAPKYWCDSHHLVHWLHGGETSVDNSALLCELHHTMVHHGFTIERDRGGRWHTYRPDQTEILLGL